MIRNKPIRFSNKAAALRMAANYRKTFGIGLDGKPRRYGDKSKSKRLLENEQVSVG